MKLVATVVLLSVGLVSSRSLSYTVTYQFGVPSKTRVDSLVIDGTVVDQGREINFRTRSLRVTMPATSTIKAARFNDSMGSQGTPSVTVVTSMGSESTMEKLPEPDPAPRDSGIDYSSDAEYDADDPPQYTPPQFETFAERAGPGVSSREDDDSARGGTAFEHFIANLPQVAHRHMGVSLGYGSLTSSGSAGFSKFEAAAPATVYAWNLRWQTLNSHSAATREIDFGWTKTYAHFLLTNKTRISSTPVEDVDAALGLTKAFVRYHYSLMEWNSTSIMLGGGVTLLSAPSPYVADGTTGEGGIRQLKGVGPSVTLALHAGPQILRHRLLAEWQPMTSGQRIQSLTRQDVAYDARYLWTRHIFIEGRLALRTDTVSAGADCPTLATGCVDPSTLRSSQWDIGIGTGLSW